MTLWWPPVIRAGRTGAVNYPMLVAICAFLVIYVTMVYGPIAAWLVELFPTAHPLHLDVAALSHRQWLVWRLPAGHLVRDRGGDREYLYGLWYPITVAVVTVITRYVLLPETVRQATEAPAAGRRTSSSAKESVAQAVTA